ncbi:unnamed protein product [Prorocentrum cordatum]|uniref:Fe2OG dioxygenase domain-containing protein n=1 Tax=Prorocentrum cordatum TaxID=2364126 RepID=A0ABN9U526_9DINO|nr:unnamed protein product [Polarella glacialis]
MAAGAARPEGGGAGRVLVVQPAWEPGDPGLGREHQFLARPPHVAGCPARQRFSSARLPTEPALTGASGAGPGAEGQVRAREGVQRPTLSAGRLGAGWNEVFYLRGTENGQGALMVVPGSHRSAEVGYERARHYRTLVEQHGEYIPEEVITSGDLGRAPDGSALPVKSLPVPGGSVVLFDANLLHCVQPNLSTDTPSERVACHFIPGDLDTGFRGTSFRRGHFADRHLIVHADGRVATEDDAGFGANGHAEEAAAKRPRTVKE